MINKTTGKETMALMDKLWPIERSEELKVYGIFSCKASVADQILGGENALSICSAFNDNDAMMYHTKSLEPLAMQGVNLASWRFGVSMRSVPFQQLIPTDQIERMIGTIETHHLGIGEEQKADKEVEALVAYTRFVFARAGASPVELRALERTIERFRQSFS